MKPVTPGLGYRLFSLLLLPLWLYQALWQRRKYRLPAYLGLRLRGYRIKSTQPLVWIHAASVGEVEAVTPLVKKLLNRREAILFSSFTASGLQTIERNFGDSVESCVIPADLFWLCKKFIRQANIKLCLLMETELWPELLYQTARQGIPIIQINARLSRKSLDAPHPLRNLLKRSMSYVTLYLTRNENDRDNLISLGAEAEKIKIIGNLKTAIDDRIDYPRLVERDYLLIASTHDGEESALVAKRPASLENHLLVIAPRHPQRGQSIRQLLSKLGVRTAMRSLSQPIEPDTQIYLADTLGELKALFAHAHVVIMGGSFDQSGGHNLIEPAALGCAIITGPSDANIKQDIDLLGDGVGVIQVANVDACWQAVEDLLSDSGRAGDLGAQAKLAVSSRIGILDDYLREIVPYL